MRRAARVDANHAEIVKALANAGMKAHSTAALGGGFPDLVVGFRGLNVLLEVKDGAKAPSEQKLTAAEQEFFGRWPGQVHVVRTPIEAITAVLKHANDYGRI